MLNDAKQTKALRATLLRFIKSISVAHYNKLKFDEEIYDLEPNRLNPLLEHVEARFYVEMAVQDICPGRRVCAV